MDEKCEKPKEIVNFSALVAGRWFGQPPRPGRLAADPRISGALSTFLYGAMKDSPDRAVDAERLEYLTSGFQSYSTATLGVTGTARCESCYLPQRVFPVLCSFFSLQTVVVGYWTLHRISPQLRSTKLL